MHKLIYIMIMIMTNDNDVQMFIMSLITLPACGDLVMGPSTRGTYVYTCLARADEKLLLPVLLQAATAQ